VKSEPVAQLYRHFVNPGCPGSCATASGMDCVILPTRLRPVTNRSHGFVKSFNTRDKWGQKERLARMNWRAFFVLSRVVIRHQWRRRESNPYLVNRNGRSCNNSRRHLIPQQHTCSCWTTLTVTQWHHENWSWLISWSAGRTCHNRAVRSFRHCCGRWIQPLQNHPEPSLPQPAGTVRADTEVQTRAGCEGSRGRRCDVAGCVNADGQGRSLRPAN